MKTISIYLFLLPIFFLVSCKSKPEKSKLEKIIFHTSECFGSCSQYHLEIDSNKNLKLYAEIVYVGYEKNKSWPSQLDKSKMGYFKGIVSDTSFNKITEAIQKIGIDSLKFDGGDCCDGSLITIIIYFDKKYKYLQSMFPPQKAENLIMSLWDVCINSKLERTNTAFEIEYEKVK